VVGLVDHVFRSTAAKDAFHHVSEPPTIKIGGSSILWSSERLLVITLATADASGRVTLEGQLMLDLTSPAGEEGGEVRGGGRLTGLLRETAKNVVHRVDEGARYNHSFSARPKW
jgi:hypothetical protein